MVVEDGLLERGRENLVGAEADRVLELLAVGDVRDVDHANADPGVREAEPDTAPRHAAALEELVQRRRERGRVADLAAGDDALGKRCVRDAGELLAAVVDHVRGGQAAGLDLQPDELVRQRPLLRRLGLRRPALALGQLRDQVGELQLLVQVDHRV